MAKIKMVTHSKAFFFFFNFLISEVLQIFPKHLSNLLEFTLEKKNIAEFSQCFW